MLPAVTSMDSGMRSSLGLMGLQLLAMCVRKAVLLAKFTIMLHILMFALDLGFLNWHLGPILAENSLLLILKTLGRTTEELLVLFQISHCIKMESVVS